jgi:hypothetical protein
MARARIKERFKAYAENLPLQSHLPEGFGFNDETKRFILPRHDTLACPVSLTSPPALAWFCQDPVIRPGSSYVLLVLPDFNLPAARHLLYFSRQPGGGYVPHHSPPIPGQQEALQLAFAALCRSSFV